jgi:hypothetical protein
MPDYPEAVELLRSRLENLIVAGPVGLPGATAREELSGVLFRGVDPKNKAFSYVFDFSEGGGTLTYEYGKGVHTIHAEAETWTQGYSRMSSDEPQKIAAQGAWTAQDTFTIVVKYINSPATTTIETVFGDGTAILRFYSKGSFTPGVGPILEGTAT